MSAAVRGAQSTKDQAKRKTEESEVRALMLSVFATIVLLSLSLAQTPDSDPNPPRHGDMDMAGMERGGEPGWMPSPHAGSGTAWQPSSTAGHMWMERFGGWDWMAHGVIFLDYNQQGGPRGAGKAESVNWLMLMQQHRLGKGSLLFREMLSAESLTAPHPGFPELFQTGETYHGQPLVDHQHPHNVFAELAVEVEQPIGVLPGGLQKEKVSWELYGAAAGEPALGPVAFMHRASAAELPAAPLSHHLQDSTHTSFGVITTGLVFDHFKIEASAFNGREPDERRYGIQFAALDSWSARWSFAPTARWTGQYSYGRLEHPEALEPGSQHRQTASVEYVWPWTRGGWATSLVWGRVHRVQDDRKLNSYLLESTVNFQSKNYAFGRAELVDKDELFPGNPAQPSYRVGAYTFGGVRDLVQGHLWQLGVGADLTIYSKPSVLDAAYGDYPVSFQIFLRVRPAKNPAGH